MISCVWVYLWLYLVGAGVVHVAVTDMDVPRFNKIVVTVIWPILGSTVFLMWFVAMGVVAVQKYFLRRQHD